MAVNPHWGSKQPLAPLSKGSEHLHVGDGGIARLGSRAPPYWGLGTPSLWTRASLC